MKKISINYDILYDLYIIKNLTVNNVAKELSVSTTTIARLLKQNNIKKDEALRRENISKTINSRTDCEKEAYSKKISNSLRGKQKACPAWNKGKHTGNGWLGKNHSKESRAKISSTKLNKSDTEKQITSEKLSKALKGRKPWNKNMSMVSEQKEKIRQTLLNKSTDELQEITLKRIKTLKLHKTIKYSKPEDEYYEFLCTKFKEDDIIRQYIDHSRYPFYCDFYIISLDLFIELNFSWTHGGHKFNENSIDDAKKLEYWKNKAVTSDYYRNAIDTWTIRDPLKFKTAKENKLNYVTFYSEKDALEYFSV